MEYLGDDALPELSDEAFQAERQRVRAYTAVILVRGARFPAGGPEADPDAWGILFEHGKRNTRLHKAGLLPIVCPISDGGRVAGIGIFDATIEDVERIMADDPAVRAGILEYEIHPTRSFPGSMLAGPDGS